MKGFRASVKRICDKCKVVRRRGVVRRDLCGNSKHKQGRGERFFMARIAGVDLPRTKRSRLDSPAFTASAASGRTMSWGQAGVSPDIRVKDLSRATCGRSGRVLEEVGGVGGRSPQGEISLNIKRLMEIGCYRGLRHRRNLPRARAADAGRTPRTPRRVRCKCADRQEEDGASESIWPRAKRERRREGRAAAKKKVEPRKTFKKRGEKRVVHHSLVHIHASFNNTQHHDHRHRGQRDCVVERGWDRVQKLPQGHAVCGHPGRHQRRQRGQDLRSCAARLRSSG